MLKNEALKRFLHPKSIAIIGVSQDFTSIGGKPLKNLIRKQFPGTIYPVNPKYDEVLGYRCYPSIRDIPGEVDVALVAVSNTRIEKVIHECAEKNIKHLILFGSGFAEVGEEGKQLQNQVLELAKGYGIHIIGPNCLGLLNVKNSIPLGFATSFETEKAFITGNVGLVSQSGAHGFSIFGLAQEEHIGFSYVINTGNQMDLTTLDCISFMLEDESTEVISAYLEGIPDGGQFIRLAKRARELNKPLIIIKAGKSELGKKAALSHTASLAGSEETFQAIAKQYGIIQVNDIDEMLDAIKVFSRGKLAKGPRLAALTNSGAAGIAMADFSDELKLDLVRLSKDTEAKIKAIIPAYGSALNPIDVTAQALKEQHILIDSLEILTRDDQVDVIVLQTTFGGPLGEKICQAIADFDQRSVKPILITLTGTAELTGAGRAILQRAGVPVYQTSYKTINAIKHLVQFSQYREEITPDELETDSDERDLDIMQKVGVWTEEKVKQQLAQLGIRTPQGTLVKSVDHLDEIKAHLQYPLVAKVVSKDVLHKTDAGGVIVGVESADQLTEAYAAIVDSVLNHVPGAEIDGILAEEMIVEKGAEMFIGIKDDPQFGSFIVCGLGGIFVEVFKDVSIRHVPISIEDANDMLQELKGLPMLLGARGAKKKDIDELARTLVKISQFASLHEGRVQEMDINPLVVLEEGKGVVALDGMIVWKETGLGESR